jgi:hypothetical protein
MLVPLLILIIISNMMHLVMYSRDVRHVLCFYHSLFFWNVSTVLFILWLMLVQPTDETLDWLSSIIR